MVRVKARVNVKVNARALYLGLELDPFCLL